MALSLPPILSNRRLRWTLLGLVGFLALYTLVGFLVLPPVVRSLLERKLGEALHREVAIEHIAVNPFALTADVAGVSVKTTDGREVAGADSLHVDLQAESLLRGGPVLREVRLAGPRVHVVRLAADRYDISDLIEDWSKPSDGPTPIFSVSNIQVSDGKLVFEDKPAGATHTVSDLALNLPFLSNLPNYADIFVEPHFSAKVNGAPLVLTGRSKPFADIHESELSLDLDRVDLTRYLAYFPLPLPFKVQGGSLDTELKLLFRQGHQEPATLKLAGAVHIKDLALQEAGGAPLLAWKQMDLALKEGDVLKRRFAVDSVRLVGPDGQIRANPQGKLNWAEVADRLARSPAPGKAETKAGSQAAPVTWTVGEIRLENGTLRYQDQGQAGLPVQIIDRIEAKVLGLSSQPGQKLNLNLAARINEKGGLKAAGDIQMEPLAATLDVDVEALPLLPLQPYFGNRLNLTLTRGQLSGKGQLKLETGPDGLGGDFKGQLNLADLHSVDKASNADFLHWKSLYVGNIDARLQPLALSIGEVSLSDFYARLTVSPKGQLNLMQIVRPPEAPAAAKPAQAAAAAPGPGPIPVRIGKVSLQGGTVNFSDYFVKPNYTANVTRIAGRINGLSSAAGTLADLELRGNYGNGAPVEVTAKLNPLAAKSYLDLKGEIRGVDLTTLSTYSGKYAGYAIDKGKLSLFVTYRLDDNQLVADNRVFLDQLTFGERVDSPDATSLPVKLAIALLKNGRGEIDVNLPISGSLDDPQFSLGGVIARVIGNLFVRAVTSPFALLGSLFGGGEELSTVDFDGGRTALTAAATRRLEALAKAMNDRPGLKLEIAGRADPESDREGLKRLALERAAKAEKQKDLAKKAGEGSSLDAVSLDAREYPVYLQRAYKEAKFPKPRNVIGLQKELPLEEVEKLMLANQPVGDEDLRQLAVKRAESVQAWLVEQGKVPMERLFLLPPRLGPGDKDKGSPSRVEFSLR